MGDAVDEYGGVDEVEDGVAELRRWFDLWRDEGEQFERQVETSYDLLRGRRLKVQRRGKERREMVGRNSNPER